MAMSIALRHARRLVHQVNQLVVRCQSSSQQRSGEEKGLNELHDGEAAKDCVVLWNEFVIMAETNNGRRIVALYKTQ